MDLVSDSCDYLKKQLCDAAGLTLEAWSLAHKILWCHVTAATEYDILLNMAACVSKQQCTNTLPSLYVDLELGGISGALSRI